MAEEATPIQLTNPIPTGIPTMTLDQAFDATIRANATPQPSSQQTPNPQPDAGQAQVAPDAGQGGDKPDEPAKVNDAAPDKGQAVAGPTPEEILAQLNPTETSEAKLARLERDGGASRKEALRLKKVVDGLQELMSSQDIEIVFDESGAPKHLAPGKNFASGKAADFSVKFADLTEEQQTRYESDPQALIDLVVNRAKKAFVRAAPTVEKAIQPLSPEHEKAVKAHVASVTFDDGKTLKNPNFEKNTPVIDQHLNAPQNEALREFHRQMPDMCYTMLNALVENVKTTFFAAAKLRADATKNEKEAEAAKTFVPGPQGGGEASIPSGNMTPEQLSKYWLNEIVSSDRR